MSSALVDFPHLREGVSAVRVPRGVLFHDALRWKLFLVPNSGSPQGALQWITSLGLVRGAEVPRETPRISQTFLVRRDEAPAGPFVAAADARFACSGCGASCRTMNLGPILPADVDRLLQLDWSATQRDPSRFFVDRAGQRLEAAQFAERREVFLRREGDRCQFLLPDNRCDAHARFGALAKPHMCRAFPLVLRAAPGGVVVGMRLGECMEAEKAGLGDPIGEDVETLRHLWSELPKVPMLPPLVWLGPGKLVRWDEYEALERRLLAETAPGGLALLLRAMRSLGVPVPEACAPGELQAVASAALEGCSGDAATGLPLARVPAAGFDERAARLEDRVARLSLFNKDAFQFSDALSGLGCLAVELYIARLRALELAGRAGAPLASAEHLNHAIKEVSRQSVRERLARAMLHPAAAAARI